MTPILVHLQPYDLHLSERIDVRLADAATADAYGLGGHNWRPVITERPVMSMELFSPDMKGKVSAGRARVSFNLDQLGLAGRRIKWAGASVKIYSAAALAWPALTEFDGEVLEPAIDTDNGIITLTLEVSTEFLDGPLLVYEFSGGLGITGEPEMRGTLYPAGFGICENIQPVWFDKTRWIGMIDGYDNTLDISRLMEGLDDRGAKVADYADYQALADAIDAQEIAPGQWGTCIAKGLVGLGAPPAAPITVNAAFGGNRLGTIMMRILEIHRGVPIEQIDVDAFEAVNLAVPFFAHYWTAEQRDVKDLLEAMAGSMNATPLVTFQKVVTITRAVSAAPVATLDRSGSIEPRVVDSRPASSDKPVYRVRARAARPAYVNTLEEVLYEDTIEDKGLYRDDVTYRAGHVVWLADKSSWLYTNATPGFANPPPVWPDTENEWWTNLSPPLTSSDLTYADGTPIEALKPGDANATRNQAAQLLNDAEFLPEYWTFDPINRPFDSAIAPSGRAMEIHFLEGEENLVEYRGTGQHFFEVEEGRRVFFRLIAEPEPGELHLVYEGEFQVFEGDDPVVEYDASGADWTLSIGVDWYDAAGALIERQMLATLVPAEGRTILTSDAIPPEGADRARFLIGHLEDEGFDGTWTVWSPWVSEHQPSADNTVENSPIIVPPLDQVVLAAADGTPNAGQLPRTLAVKRKRGANDVTVQSAWSVAFVNATGSIDDNPVSATRGAVTIETMTADTATVSITSEGEGVPISHVMKVTKQRAGVETGGGSGGSPTPGATFSVSAFVDNPSYGDETASREIVVAGDEISCILALTYTASAGAVRVAGKWQHSPAGAATWTDFGAEIVGSLATDYAAPGGTVSEGGDIIEGYADINQIVSGLTPGDYDVRLILRLYSGATAAYCSGTATISTG